MLEKDITDAMNVGKASSRVQSSSSISRSTLGKSHADVRSAGRPEARVTEQTSAESLYAETMSV